MADIRITPAASVMAFTSSLNFIETLTQGASGSVVLTGSGSVGRTNLFAVDGNNGRLFSIDDDLSDSIFSVNTIAGLPVIEAFANNTVIMGKNTWESIPKNFKPLKNRKNIVITSSKLTSTNKDLIYLNIESAKNYINNNLEDIFIIGGESIYKEFVNNCSYIYLTRIYDNYNCDRFFNYDLSLFLEEFKSEMFTSKNKNINFKYFKLKNINK
jgi:dihydrofolate reductase